MITALELIKIQLKSAHEGLEGTVGDVTSDVLHKSPGGKAFSVAALYAHLVFSEDGIVHGMIQGKAPLFETTFKDKTGASEASPAMDENWAAANEVWSNSVQIDLPTFKEYAHAVYAATDTYLASLKDEDLDQEIDLGSWGKKPLFEILSLFLVAHTNQLMGELSAVKGVHGSKGYPF